MYSLILDACTWTRSSSPCFEISELPDVIVHSGQVSKCHEWFKLLQALTWIETKWVCSRGFEKDCSFVAYLLVGMKKRQQWPNQLETLQYKMIPSLHKSLFTKDRLYKTLYKIPKYMIMIEPFSLRQFVMQSPYRLSNVIRKCSRRKTVNRV